MENAEEIFHFLEEFSKRKPKTIPQELNNYLAYVARTGDPVYQWSLVKCLFKEKFLNVITDFYETSPGIDIPTYPNVDPFNYDIMKNSLLERLDSFTSAPFTVQRICELLTNPRKQYNRIDKYMRAIEKNILVVSTREPGPQRHLEPENGEPLEPMVNGSDNNSDYNVDVEMEDMSWKENAEQQSSEPQPGSSDSHISVDDIEARLQAKQETSMETQDKTTTQYESVTPPELNVTDEQIPETKATETSPEATMSSVDKSTAEVTIASPPVEPKVEIEMKTEAAVSTLVIPEIKVDDVVMTEQRLSEESNSASQKDEETSPTEEITKTEVTIETPPSSIDENSSDSSSKEEAEPKLISEVSTSSEESSSSSDNTDGNSNSPKTDSETHIDVQEESNQSDTNLEAPVVKEKEELKEQTDIPNVTDVETSVENTPPTSIQSDNYSISDVNSELPQVPSEPPKPEPVQEEIKVASPEKEKVDVEPKPDDTDNITENKES